MVDNVSDYITRQDSLSNTKRKIKWMFALGCLICLASYRILYSANILLDAPDRLLIIPRGCTLYQLKEKLKQEGFIKNESTFWWTAYLLRYRPSPGQYRLISNTSNWQTIKMLRSAMQYPVKLTFTTAANKESLVEQLVKHIGLQKETLLALLNNAQQLAAYGFSTENVLTMFIPDTYAVYWTITAERLLSKIYARYQCFWNAVRLDKAAKMQLSPIAVSILASIVQAETNDQQEAAMIAGVYFNRLKRKMPIQSDPVLVYVLKHKGSDIKRVLHKDTYMHSPYNSYRTKGLPPGPIALPSVAMIDAVLNYVAHDYLFFSAKEDFSGLHYFARHYAEHLKNANKFRKVLNTLKIMR